MEGIQYHDRHETIALEIARPLSTIVQCRNVVPQGGRQTQAACIQDVGSTQNCWLLAERQTTQRKQQRGTWYECRH